MVVGGAVEEGAGVVVVVVLVDKMVCGYLCEKENHGLELVTNGGGFDEGVFVHDIYVGCVVLCQCGRKGNLVFESK